MRLRAPASLQGRLLALVLGAVAAVWLAAAAWTWIDARHELDELLDSHLAQAAALLIAQQIRAPDDEHAPHEEERSLHRYAPRVAFQVWHEGSLVLHSANAPTRPMAAQDEGFATLKLDGARWRVFAARGAKRDVRVYVGERVDARDAILGAVMRGILAPLALALPLLAGLVWWAVRHGLAPLQRLRATLAARAPDALQPVVQAGAPAELQGLIGALNALLARIGALLESERRFTADAAHELRTPIAAIRAQAQVAQGAAGDDAARRHALEATIAGCDRAARLVDQLLTLARLDSDAARERRSVDLAALARTTIAELAPQALARDQQVELEAPRPCPADGDETLFAVLLRNLVDNALRYSPAGARVRVTLAGERDWRLTVEDSGPGLGAAERARLGERFFRVLGNEASGSGLGWSIVRRIAQVQGLALAVDESPALGGLRVTVSTRPA
ncbi:MAG: ATP-binding protein [Betaproteobacteria bacterium]